jgi:tRNA dimethylallyltransferase
VSAPNSERRVVAIVGATATGKTAVAGIVARRLGAEVVCVDSRQLYRDLEIGTGKPPPAERAALPHHLFDLLALDERTSAGAYARAAAEVAGAIHARHRPVVLVGGSGLYLNALRKGLAAQPPRDPVVRAAIERRGLDLGVEGLHAELARRDPDTAARLAVRDRQRIVRALEVLEVSGRPLSWWHAAGAAPALAAEWSVFELVADPGELRRTIAGRTRAMLSGGLVEETLALLGRGLGDSLRALRAIGYDEALDLIAGRRTAREAEEAINLRTSRLAKRQRTWFRHQVEAVRIGASSGDGPPEDAVLRHLT